MSELLKEIYIKVKSRYKEKEEKIPTTIFVSIDVLKDIVKTTEFKEENKESTLECKLFGCDIMCCYKPYTVNIEGYIEVI